jgi:glucose-1-phosphate cytidylyltransferase
MQTVILAGGFGTRLSEETKIIPKPMIEIGNKPILWHIMKIYSHYGYNDFIICGGYKQDYIKEYFKNYFIKNSDVSFDLKNNSVKIHRKQNEDWKITIVDTGITSNTGGRLKKIQKFIKNDNFFLTYGDGLSDVNISKLLNFHLKNKKLATLTAVRPEARYGILEIKNNLVKKFNEKPTSKDSWINGGFFVLNKKIFKFIKNYKSIWEQEPLKKITNTQNLCAYKHLGFWQSMDTLREKKILERLWSKKNPPWKIW